jgi:MFS family permease
MSSAVRASSTRLGVPVPLRERDFRLLWAGQAISTFGDQFALVALPWLALRVSGSGVALGGVLAAMAIPRAVLMLVGGVYVDRLSPRRVMLITSIARMVVMTLLAGIVMAAAGSLAILYAFAFVFGVADAFWFPAQNAILPQVVGPNELPFANVLMQGTTQTAVFLGPAIAGTVVAGLGGRASTFGLGVALLIDTISFVAPVVTLALVRRGGAAPAAREPFAGAVREGLLAVWRWPALRFVVFFAMAINFLVVGPMTVGLPVLAFRRLPDGAAGYGTLMSAMGGGSLAGIISVVAGPRPPAERLGSVVLSIMALVGIGLAGLALAASTPVAALLAAVVGYGLGYGNLSLSTWVQQRVPAELLGRVFSLILLASVALIPLSQVVAGFLVDANLETMLVIGGSSMTAVALAAATTSTVRSMGLEPLAQPAPATTS